MTSRLPRTLKIGTGKVFCTRYPKITFKTSKNNCIWVIVHVYLNMGAGRPSLKKVCDTIGKWKILCVLHSLNFLSSKNEVLFFFQ